MIAVEEETQTKTVSLANVAGTKQLENDFRRVKLELSHPSRGLRHVIFDMSVVDPLKTNSARVFEMVRQWQSRLEKKRISVGMKLPQLIFDDLQRTERQIPRPVRGNARYGGIGIEVIDPIRHPAREIDVVLGQLVGRRDEGLRKQETILGCIGKIREIAGNRVTVSLFAREGEIVGEFERSQFPDPSLQVGKTFTYKATTKEAGITQTTVQWIPERELSREELDAIDRFVDSNLPPEPHMQIKAEIACRA